MSSVTVMNLCNPNEKRHYTCTPREAVIAAYAQTLRKAGGNTIGDWNTWQYEERYGHLVIEGKYCIACGDWSAFKDGRSF